MTTLTFKNGVFATDTLCDSESYVTEIRKLFWHKDNTLIGISGRANAAAAFVHWFCFDKLKAHPPDFSTWVTDDSEGLFNVMIVEKIVKRNLPFRYQITYWNEHCRPVECLSEFSAEGSGAQSALAAMFCGKSAVEAIQVASRFDAQTGGSIEYADFNKIGEIFKCNL